MNEPDTARANVAAVTISVQSLLDERHALHASTLHQPAGSGLWTGNFRGPRRGHGTDFDDLRHYSPGDEMRYIDWNASARTNILHTRLYREEREHRVTLIADLRGTMFTGTQALRSVRASQLAARLMWQAVDGGSRASVIIISDKGIAASEYGNGHRAAINACGLLARRFHANRNTSTANKLTNPETPDDVLITLLEHQSDNAITTVSCENVARWLITQRQLHGTVIWISAFDQCGDNFNDAMNTLSQATRQVALYVHDEMLEHGLPSGRYGYRSGDVLNRTSHAITLNHTQGSRLQQQLLQQKQERINRFSDLQIPMLSTDIGNTEIVSTLRQSGLLP